MGLDQLTLVSFAVLLCIRWHHEHNSYKEGRIEKHCISLYVLDTSNKQQQSASGGVLPEWVLADIGT